MFSCDLCEISKNIFSTEHHRMTASEHYVKKLRRSKPSLHLVKLRVSKIGPSKFKIRKNRLDSLTKVWKKTDIKNPQDA